MAKDPKKLKIKIKKKKSSSKSTTNTEISKSTSTSKSTVKPLKSAKESTKKTKIGQEIQKKEYNLPEPDYAAVVAKELGITTRQTTNVINLLDDDNTIPFISRYRKEQTGSLDEVAIRDIDKKTQYLRSLTKRKKEILSSILTQDKLTPELEKKILKSDKISEIEELYLPYKPKKKTKGIIAKEFGLEPLAIIIKTEDNAEAKAEQFIDTEKGIDNVETAITHASYIIAEEFAENFEVRKHLRQYIKNYGEYHIKKKTEEKDEFDMYKDYEEPVNSIKNHRILAINRGEKKGILSVKTNVDNDEAFAEVYKLFLNKNQYNDNKIHEEACRDGFKRLLFKSIEKDIRSELTKKAELEAIDVFSQNLYDLLMTPPLKNQNIMAIDPGIRTGSKVVILNRFGNYVTTDLVYQLKEDDTKRTIAKYVKKYEINLIAIGNGTACRDVEKVVAAAITQYSLDCKYLLVAETGASIYSASDVAREEFPDLDVTVRGAISIGRRVLDPLSEFVKIDPKSLGVGQYQHDVNQRELSGKLDEVVEQSVNQVGVVVNTASSQLLKYVSGLSTRAAKSIVKYRLKNGPYKSRKDLLSVPGFGKKTFEQAAGFLRVPESNNFLDNSWVHPESYEIAEELRKIQDKGKNLDNKLKLQIAKQYGKGIETIDDILEDLKKPGRDPREDIEKPILRDDILTIQDLKTGMQLKGTVRNVTKFGAFVDIGLKNEGLVHISEIADEYVEDPLSKVHVGQIVDVTVIDIDTDRKRVGLSMRSDANASDRKTTTKKKSKSTPKKSASNNRPRNTQKDDKQTLGDLFKNIDL